MKKKLGLTVFLLAVLIIFMFNFPFSSATDPLKFSEKNRKIVEKVQGEAFVIEIEFKNTGKDAGKWNINVAFEGESWNQEGNSQNLELEPDEEKKLNWEGTVPANAPINTVARLVVYYEDSFKALNWWIQVVPEAELTIKSSCVK
ncbi:MAG: hypothetical protein NWF10_01830 [Candidatus Bathyarchaeota archaeon]|nr:hypothetical protein [Candidatus Bathyarchaeota archaeon]